jgi:hypothetical protein
MRMIMITIYLINPLINPNNINNKLAYHDRIDPIFIRTTMNIGFKCFAEHQESFTEEETEQVQVARPEHDSTAIPR